MSKVADGIRRGLQEAVAYARGEAEERDYRIHVPRGTHDEFARRSGLSVETLSRGEPHKRRPK